jgi:hypothetical protein
VIRTGYFQCAIYPTRRDLVGYECLENPGFGAGGSHNDEVEGSSSYPNNKINNLAFYGTRIMSGAGPLRDLTSRTSRTPEQLSSPYDHRT